MHVSINRLLDIIAISEGILVLVRILLLSRATSGFCRARLPSIEPWADVYASEAIDTTLQSTNRTLAC